MTAPTRSRRASTAKANARVGSGRVDEVAPNATAPTVEPSRTKRPSSGKGRTSAAERAYARRAQRAEVLSSRPEAAEKPITAKPVKTWLRWPKSRASFVLIMMSLLAGGVATTLWLSTQAIADSYRLERVKQDNALLAERAEQLQRAVAKQESISELAQKAKELGMVPGGDPARILVNADGSTTLVGEPRVAVAPPPPPPPPVQQQPPVTPTLPIEGDVAANPDQPDSQAPAGQQLPPEQIPAQATSDPAAAGAITPPAAAGAAPTTTAPQPSGQQPTQQGPALGGAQ